MLKLLTASLLLASLPITVATAAFAEVAPRSSSVVIAQTGFATLVSHDGNSPINVRDGASTSAYVRHIAYAGDRVEVLDRTVNNGYMWYYVRFTVSNATGWIRGDFVALDGD